MEVMLMLLELHIYDSNSLKAKRRVLNSLKDSLKRRYNISIAEVDYLDKWQRTKIGIVKIGNGNSTHVFDRLLEHIKSLRGVNIIDYEVVRLL